MLDNLKTYYVLTKPGIIRGNVMIAIGAFLLGSGRGFDTESFFGMLIGLSLVIASACVYNNVLDRGIDAKMKRTKERSLVTGKVSVNSALIYASVLLIAGLALLITATNVVAALLALFGHFAYVVLYGIGKRKTVYGTLIGSISGSIPPVVGYVAATGSIDMVAVLLFVVLTAWQMPHFYAIAIYRKCDYEKAGLPILSVVKGVTRTRREIVFYVCLFIVTVGLMYIYAPVGYTYLVVMALLCTWWLAVALKGSSAGDVDRWAKSVFGISLVTLLGFSAVIGTAAYLP